MSLFINKPVGLTPEDETGAHGTWQTIEKVQSRLADKGITVRDDPPPFPMPEITTTLVASDNVDYLKVNTQYLVWLNYLTPHLAIIKGSLLEIRNEKEHISAMYKEANRQGEEMAETKSPKDSVSNAVLLDPRHIELRQQEQELMQEEYQIDEHVNNLVRTMKVLSRNIEMKKLDADQNRINANMPQRRPFNPGGR
jgi:hypothetical protein